MSRHFGKGLPQAEQLGPVPPDPLAPGPRLTEGRRGLPSGNLGRAATAGLRERGGLPGGARAAAAASEGTNMQAHLSAARHESGSQNPNAEPPLAPWGVQLAGDFSKEQALATYARARQPISTIIGDAPPLIISTLLRYRGTRAFYQVRVPAGSRATADAFCDSIHAVGGSCAVLAN
jgi:hypothetical protein